MDDTERGLLKAVVKQAGVQLQARQVAPVLVSEWGRKIEEAANDVEEILQVSGGGD